MKICHLLFMMFLTLVSVAATKAQSISGNVLDEQGNAMMHVKVELLTSSDSVVVAVGVSKEDGTFQLKTDKKEGILRFSFVGYRTLCLPVQGEQIQNVRMKPDVIALGGVEVSASSTSQHGSRTNIVITKDLRQGVVSAAQMLGKLPNFRYSYAERTLEYNNSHNICVLVDSIQKDVSYLNNMQHIRFDRIEIILNPQGQYRGYDVLVNLHTKENYEGYEGQLFNNDAVNFNKYNDKHFIFENSEAAFSYTKNRVSMYTNVRHYFGQASMDVYDKKQYLLSGITEEVVHSPNGKKNCMGFDRSIAGMVDVDYRINKRQYLSFVYRYDNGGNNDAYGHYTIKRICDVDSVVSQFERNITNHENSNEHSLGLFYRNNERRINWNSDINCRLVDSKSLTYQTESTGFTLNNQFRNSMDFTRFRLSANTDFADGHLALSAGYINTWKSYERRDYETYALLNSNSYLRNQLWTAASCRLKNNTELSVSAWAEHVHLKDGDKERTQIPVGGSFMAYYKFTSKNWMRLNYYCSTEYPDQSLSSQYGYFTDSLNWVGGNPWLKTNVTHRVNFWIDLWQCLNFQAGFVLSPNSFSSIVEIREGVLPGGATGKYAASVFQNTQYHDWWMSMSFTKRFWKNFVYKADVKYVRGKASYKEFTNRENLVGFFTSLSYYNTKWDMNCFFSYNYHTNYVLGPQKTNKSEFEEPYISVQKFLFNKRLELGLEWRMMFHFFDGNIVSETFSPAMKTLNVDRYFKRQQNRVTFTVSYRFQGGKSVRKYNNEMSTEK